MISLTGFEIYLSKEKRYSNHTVTAYINDVRQFFIFTIGTEDIQSRDLVANLSKVTFRTWIYDLSNQNLDSKSINRKISSIKRFSKWIISNGIEINESIFEVEALKTSKKLPVFLTQTEMEKVLDKSQDELVTANGTEFENCRDYLIVFLLYATGIRKSELINLKTSNIDFDRKVLKVQGKGNKERFIPIIPVLEDKIKKYLKIRNNFQLQSIEYLLVNKSNKKISEKFVHDCVKKLLYLATGNANFSTHKLRHTFATQLLNNGAELESIKELLGHSSLASTQVYTHNNIEVLKEIYKQSHPESKEIEK